MALAVKRVFKADTVWVREIIVVAKGRSRQTYVTPPEVEGFVESYDSAILEFESPGPFSFTLDAPQDVSLRHAHMQRHHQPPL